MEKTEMMKRYEAETGFTDAIVMVKIGFAKLYFPSLAYVQWIEERFAKSEAKAPTYGRLMSGGIKTPNDIVNFFGTPGLIIDDGDLILLDDRPIVDIGFNEDGEPYDDIRGANQIGYIEGKFDASEYEDGVVLPDGWEEDNGKD
jgi:hypothetical protein